MTGPKLREKEIKNCGPVIYWCNRKWRSLPFLFSFFFVIPTSISSLIISIFCDLVGMIQRKKERKGSSESSSIEPPISFLSLYFYLWRLMHEGFTGQFLIIFTCPSLGPISSLRFLCFYEWSQTWKGKLLRELANDWPSTFGYNLLLFIFIGQSYTKKRERESNLLTGQLNYK